MTKSEELGLFLKNCDELIQSKYILADVKIVNLLKSIAQSETLLALFKSCLIDFDFENAKKKYLVSSKYLSNEKGEFVLPNSSRELLAFIFNVLVDIDAKRIELGAFLDKYFYENGSFTQSYINFINSMVKPFRNTVKMLLESVISGKVQDPIESITEQEAMQEKLKAEEQMRAEKEKQILAKNYGESIKAIKEILLEDKKKVKGSKLNEVKKQDFLLIIDTFANVIESEDKDAVIYAYTAYKYLVKSKTFMFFNRAKKVGKLVQDVINGI